MESKQRILDLTISQLCDLKPNINLHDKPESPHWDKSRYAYYVLNLLLGCSKSTEIINLRALDPVTDYTQGSLVGIPFLTNVKGREELLAIYKYVGEGEYENDQYDLRLARGWKDGRKIIKEIHNKTVDKEKGMIVHYPVFEDMFPFDNQFSELTTNNQKQIMNVQVKVRIISSDITWNI